MRLISYDRGGARRLGAWVGETVVDLPEAVGHPAFPPTMEALVQHIGGSILDAAHDILEDEEVVAECTVARPSVLPPLAPPSRPMTVVKDGGRVASLRSQSDGAGLACIIGRASRARQADRPTSMIFGYTLVIRCASSVNGASATDLGPCVVSPDELDGNRFCLRLAVDGVSMGERAVASPQDVFGPAIAALLAKGSLEAGHVVAWLPWSFGGRKPPLNSRPGLIELSAPGIGVLRTERPK